MIFIDASALVCVIAKEPEWTALADRMERSVRRFCSAVSIWETVAALSHVHRLAPAASGRHVNLFRQEFGLELVSIGEKESELASTAYATFGKGRHPAALNMGDCFAYACAKANDARLLFKGDDFSKTDIAAA